jgi:Protein of unknown function (DUF3828)
MFSRRNVILLGACGAVAAISAAQAADPSARAFLVAIYNAYKGKNGNGISLDGDAAIRRYFEPGLAALIGKDQKEAAARGEAPALDGDPFVDAQDWDISAFDIAVRDVAPNKASGTVTFRNVDKPTTIVLDLVKAKDGWRIADITWQRDGKAETLRGLFTQQ